VYKGSIFEIKYIFNKVNNREQRNMLTKMVHEWQIKNP